MGVFELGMNVFTSPANTFGSLNEFVGLKDWLVPLILVTIAGALSAYLIMPVVQTEGLEAMSKQLQENPDLSEEQRAQVLEGVTNAGGITALVGAPIGSAANLFIQAGIFLVLTNFLLGGRGTYKKTLAVVSYGALVGIPAAIITVPLVLARKSIVVQLGPGLLLPESMHGSFLFTFLSLVNVFSIWQFALVSVGLGITSGVETRHAAYFVFGLWVIYLLVSAAAQNLLGGMMGRLGN